MPSVIQVERDAEGIQQAVFELFEESFQYSLFEGTLQYVDADARARLEDEIFARELSPGYYRRAQYLLELGSALEAGVTYGAGELTRSDVVGLGAVKMARQRFNHEHPSCSLCGTRQDNRFAFECKGCGAKFGKDAN